MAPAAADSGCTLSARLSQDDAEALFETLWRAAVGHVRAYIASVLFDRALLDDLLQNTAMTAYQKFGEYDRRRPFTAWTIGIARFEVLRTRRTAARARVVFDSEMVDKITAIYQAKLDDYEERKDALARCMEQLPDDKRALLRFRYFEAMAYTDIAERFRCQEGAIRTMLCRLRTSLEACIRQRLRQEGISA